MAWRAERAKAFPTMKSRWYSSHLDVRCSRASTRPDEEIVTPLLHPTPLLPSELLTFSIRLHLSLHVSAPSLETSVDDWRIPIAVTRVLEEALLINEAQSGTSSGWKTVVLSVLVSDLVICERRFSPTRVQETRGEKFSLLLHPSLPPLLRPQPPLSALHFFASETEEEKKLRLEMGFSTADDFDEQASHDMDVDVHEQVSTADRLPLVATPTPSLANGTGFPSNTGSQILPGPTLEPGLTGKSDDTIRPVTPALAEAPIIQIAAPTDVTVPFTAARDATKDMDRSTPFMSAPARSRSHQEKGKGTVVEASRKGEDSDSTIPELDSGSSAFGEQDDEDGTEEEGE